MEKLAVGLVLMALTSGGFTTHVNAQGQPHRTEQVFLFRPSLDPGNFAAAVTNPYFPLTPGTRHIYEAQTDDGAERTEVHITHETKEVMGVTTTVVRDTVRLEGRVIEDTYDWYAQDREGNVWYFGEEVKNYDENGDVRDNAGSWEAGVDGAVPGIIMLAEPRVGDTYRQEYYAGEAEDMGQVLDLAGAARVPHGTYENLLVTADWNPLEPGVLEHKYYARGVGVVAEEKVAGDPERAELIEIGGR